MDRRKFLQNLAATTAALQDLVNNASAADFAKRSAVPDPQPSVHRGEVDIEGYMLVSQFKIGPTVWKVYEDLRSRDGSLVFKSSQGVAKILTKSAEAAFDERDGNPAGQAEIRRSRRACGRCQWPRRVEAPGSGSRGHWQ